MRIGDQEMRGIGYDTNQYYYYKNNNNNNHNASIIEYQRDFGGWGTEQGLTRKCHKCDDCKSPSSRSAVLVHRLFIRTREWKRESNNFVMKNQVEKVREGERKRHSSMDKNVCPFAFAMPMVTNNRVN